MSDILSPSLDRNSPPALRPARDFVFPSFSRHRLNNGLPVVLAPDPTLPLARLELFAPAGGEHDPEGLDGIATFTASLLDEGSTRRDSRAIAHAAEALGGSLTTDAGWNAAYVSTFGLSTHLEATVELLSEVVLEPAFPTREIRRLAERRQASLLQRRDDSQALANLYLDRALYGDALYGSSLHGNEASLEKIDETAIRNFYQRHYRCQGAFLVAAGAVSEDQLLPLLDSSFGRLDLGPAPLHPTYPESAPGERRVWIVHRPAAAQTELRVGHVGVPRTDPEYGSLMVLNALLGGKFISRINLNLREVHGFTYGAHSRFIGRRGAGPFKVQTAVATEVAGRATEEILKEMEILRREAVDLEELEDTANYLTGIFATQLQTFDDLAARLTLLPLYDLPDDYFDQYLESFRSVTPEGLLDLAQRHLHPAQATILAVGPADALKEQLSSLGPVTVWDPQKDEILEDS
ncbi:MAG: pitrilysin family protein [Acidobacteriota bacterium]